MTFEEWFEKEFKGNPREALWTKFDLGDLRAAFDAGYEVGYKEALRVEHELNHIAKLGQEFDNGKT